MKLHLSIFFLLFAIVSKSQQKFGLNIFRINSPYTSFPDSSRNNGHIYNNIIFDAAAHYTDSSVLIVMPDNFKQNKKVNIVCWFHGWDNTIDSANERFELAKQFMASNANAILVIPEGAKNAPDSYGGKLEQPNIFTQLINDIFIKLKKGKLINSNATPGNIVLAGHSGAYRVMAHITAKGGLPINEILLFDGLYSETDKFISWLQLDIKHRYINIYTNEGGTMAESVAMMQQLSNKKIPYHFTEEINLKKSRLKNNSILFIHSNQQHNDIINKPDNFKLFLQSSPYLR
jgi:hypothetical protein